MSVSRPGAGPGAERGLGLIVARSSYDGAIGKGNELPWRIREDLRHFKRETLGRSVILGRKTFESIGKPLPRRRNIVLSRTLDAAPEGTELARTIEEALALVAHDAKKPFVIGGEVVYRAFLPYVTEAIVTEVAREVPGADAFFSLPGGEFRIVGGATGQTPGVRFRWYERTQRSSQRA